MHHPPIPALPKREPRPRSTFSIPVRTRAALDALHYATGHARSRLLEYSVDALINALDEERRTAFETAMSGRVSR